ncbi:MULTISPECIES: hypothetical protein [Methylophaga]|jgi:hypothetical protein|uniref:hypothetical protein n=1 Tax=Methylophaga TaxID=40222 RepID=UPI001CF47CEF|nr:MULTISPECIES: hypothetical protein [Methylophaga]MCB2426119.1 hypothetical protein [Methylophaga pinxianii]MDO8827782.1 hypothetical protein [Methylophaga sp.]MDX1750700.1 hypothetical protein [Methylophaga sp.]UPH47356.1 hypothetical protein LGT42_015060 [Methylophaga pinxianii]
MQNSPVFGAPRASDNMTIMALRKARTPYTLDVTLDKLRHYLTATRKPDAVELLEKAVAKAKVDKAYFERFESALMHGSTVEGRELFSDFGDYWARTSVEIPYYPHHDAVNAIDSALFHIRIGDEREAIDDYLFLHHRSEAVKAGLHD